MAGNLAKLIEQCEGFEWDEGNREKNWQKHTVSQKECEQVFLARPVIFFDDDIHTTKLEKRYGLYSETSKGRGLTVFFTIRENKVRVISARDQSRKEKVSYQSLKDNYLKKSKGGVKKR